MTLETLQTRTSRQRWVGSLRIAVGLIAMIGIGLALVFNPLRERRRALEGVRAIGGTYSFKHWDDLTTIPHGTDTDSLEPPGPRWLPHAIRVNLLSDITDIHLQSIPGGIAVTDARISSVNLACLKPESIEINGDNITDACLDRIVEVEGLRELVIVKGHITDAGVAKLVRLKDLARLWLPGSAITDGSLSHFQAMPSLTNLVAPPTFSDDAATELKRTRPRVTNFHR